MVQTLQIQPWMHKMIFLCLPFLACEDAKAERAEPKPFLQLSKAFHHCSARWLQFCLDLFMVRDISAWPRTCGSHSTHLNFMQSLFLGANTAVSGLRNRTRRQGMIECFSLRVTRALSVCSEVQICSEGKAEEQSAVQKPS